MKSNIHPSVHVCGSDNTPSALMRISIFSILLPVAKPQGIHIQTHLHSPPPHASFIWGQVLNPQGIKWARSGESPFQGMQDLAQRDGYSATQPPGKRELRSWLDIREPSGILGRPGPRASAQSLAARRCQKSDYSLLPAQAEGEACLLLEIIIRRAPHYWWWQTFFAC